MIVAINRINFLHKPAIVFQNPVSTVDILYRLRNSLVGIAVAVIPERGTGLGVRLSESCKASFASIASFCLFV